MLTHANIWNSIDRLAQAHNYSPSGLAKQAGLDPTTFNKSKRISADGKPRWPSTESIAKILAVTGATMGEFLSLGIGDDTGTVMLKPGDPVAVQLRGGDVLTGTLAGLGEHAVKIKTTAPDREQSFNRSEIEWLAHIVL